MSEESNYKLYEEERVWKECLELWKRESQIPDGKYVPKKEILIQMGIREIYKNSCPLCNYYKRKYLIHCCNECPIQKNIGIGNGEDYGCLDTSYGRWEDFHMQKDAKDFYNYLLRLYKSSVYNKIHR